MGPRNLTTLEDTRLVLPAPGLLATASDPDNDTLSVVNFTQPAHGTVAVAYNGSAVFTPARDFNGNDSFTVSESDGVAPPAVGVVVCKGFTPLTSEIVRFGAPAHVVNVPVVETNASLSVSGWWDASRVWTGGGCHQPKITAAWWPARGASSPCGASRHRTHASNRHTRGPPLPPPLLVPVNDSPVVRNQTYSTPRDQPLVVAAPGVLTNASDVDGGPLGVVSYSSPSHGNLTASPNGSFAYTPAANFVGLDSFKYNVTDGKGGYAQGTATINVGEPPAGGGHGGPVRGLGAGKIRLAASLAQASLAKK